MYYHFDIDCIKISIKLQWHVEDRLGYTELCVFYFKRFQTTREHAKGKNHDVT